MDGRRRLAEPVTDGARKRPAAGAAPAMRPVRERTRLERQLWRYLGPFWDWRIPRGAGIAAVIVFVLAAGGFGIVRGGHGPAIVSDLRAVRDAIANTAGFRITSVALAGTHQLTREEVLKIAGVTDRASLLFFDAAEARERLKAEPWIAEATVLKLYPGRLHIAVTERAPFALWQKDGKVAVISDDGFVVQRYVSKRFAGLPLVVGAGAENRAKEFLGLLKEYPLVRDRLRAAVLVAERRWNVVLTHGVEVRLPEENAEQALDTLLRLDRDNKILSRDITAIDLRLPDRATVRLSDEALAARQESLKEKKPKNKGGSA